MRAPVPRDPLTLARSVLRRLGLGLALAAAGAAAALPVADRRPVPADGELRLRMEAGRLVLRAGGEPAVAVDADLPAGMALRWREVRGGWVLAVDDRERLLPRDARLTLTVPPGLRLWIDAGDATVEADGVGESGLILRAGRSPVRIAGAGAGPLVVETTGGPLRLDLARPGRVRAATLGGALEARFASLGDADVRLETLSGDLEVRVPTGGPATFRPRLAAGTLTLPEAAKATPEGRVVLGDGAGRIDLASLAGDARVVEDATVTSPPAATPAAPPSSPGR